MSALPADPYRPRLLVEELEPRILYSADAAALLGLIDGAGVAELQELDATAQRTAAGIHEQATSRREIVFVDSRIPDAMALADQLASRRGAAQFEIVVLHADQDGLLQISRALAGETGLAAIHILSHGSDGAIEIGNSRLDSERLSVDSDAVARWGMSLSNGGDLLLYGCDVAQDQTGRAFVQKLALLTGADVAASSDTTGSSAVGANWNLEVATGLIESNFAADRLAALQWQGVLATLPGTAIFRDGASGTTPQATRWDGSSYGASAGSTAAGAWKLIAAAEAPTRNEIIAIGIDNGNIIQAEIWNGSSWSLAPITGSAAASTFHSFDVAYDRVSGNAMVVWDDAGALTFSIWNGSGWSARSAVAAYTGADPQEIRLAANPTSGEMIVVISDASNNSQALVWNGSSWGNQQALGTGSTSLPVVGVAYEQTSGNAMVLYADGASADTFYRRWIGGAWSAQQTLTAPAGVSNAVHWTEVATDASVGSNRIAVGFVTNTPKTWFAVWDGAAWNAADKLVAPANAVDPTYSTVDVAFEHDSGRLIAAYAQSGSTDVFVNTWTSAGGWSAQQVAANVGNVPNSISLEASLNGNDVMLLVQSTTVAASDSHLKSLLWDGSGWATPVQLTASTNQFKNQPFVYVWDVNAAPVVSSSGGATAYIENQAVTVVDAGLSIADVDSPTLAGATVGISGNFAAGQDALGFTDQNGIIGSWNAATGVLTLSGASSVANYQSALRSVTYFNSSDDPSGLTRTVSFIVNDGALSSAAASRSVTVTAVNDAPVVSTSGGALAYTENQVATAIDPGLIVSDLDNTSLAGATVSISANFAAGQDVVGFADQNGISGVWNAATGVMTLSGSSSIANYQAALRSVTYFNSSDDPSGLTRTVSFIVNDGALSSAAASRSVTVTAVNDAPVVSTSGGALAYTENQVATAIDPGLIVSDLDNTSLAGATVSISANFAAGQDVVGFADQNGISGVWNAATGVMTLSGSSSIANYQAALRSVTYFNSSDDPSPLARTASFVVNDGALSSTATNKSITVAPVNDPPQATNLSAAQTYVEDTPLGLTTIVISDPDNANVTATLTLSNPSAGSLNVGTSGLVTSSYAAATGVWTASGATADVNALLASLAFTPTVDFNAGFTIATSVSDGIAAALTGSKLMTGTPVNDAPLITTSITSKSYPIGSGASAIDLTLSVIDVDDGNLSGASVSISGGYVNGRDLLAFVNQGTITGTWTAATGTLDLSGAATVTAYQTALRSVTFQTSSTTSGPRVISFQATDAAGAQSAVATRTLTVGQEVPALWVSAKSGTTTSAGTGSVSYNDGQVARISGPNLVFGPGVGNGTFSRVFDIDNHAADGNADISGLHYVNSPVTVGTTNPVSLLRGDILFSVASSESFAGVAVTTRDVVLFRPVTAGDYSTGSFSILLRNPGAGIGDLREFALIETPLTIGGKALAAGDFLLVFSGSSYDKDIQRFQPTTMGTNPTAGTLSLLLDGDGNPGIGISQQIYGLEVVQQDTVLGGVSLTKGQLLISLNENATVGSNSLSVTGFDIFSLSVNAAGTAGTAAIFLRGSDVGLSSGGEEHDALALVNVYQNAPLLDPSRTPVIGAVNEDASVPAGAVGTLVSSLVDFALPAGQVDNVTDPDTDAQLGIAVIAADTTYGSWWYSIDNGSSWLDINHTTAVSNTSARLLAADPSTRLYFKPSPNYSGTINDAIIFRAWDRTSGVNGGQANTSINGGSTAFSAAFDGAAQTVSAINDAPVRSAGSLTAVNVNEDSNNATAVSLGLSGLAYGPGGGADEAGQTLSYRIVTIPSHVTLWLGDGTTPVLANAALSLPQLQGLKYKTVADANGSGNLLWTVQDNGGTANGGVDTLLETLAITVNPANDAPALSGSDNLAGINQNEMASGGTLVANLIAGYVSDVDSGAVAGIAVIGVNNANGNWQYSVDGGGSWIAFGNPSAATARLLGADASTHVRFVPNANWVGTVSGGLTFRAWDQTDGLSSGSTTSAGVFGGTTAFSAATASASVTVHAYPILFNGSYLEDFSSLGNSGTQMTAGYRSMFISGSGSTHSPGTPVSSGAIASASVGSQTLKVWKPGDPNIFSTNQLANAGSIGNVSDRALATGPTNNAASVIELAMRNMTGAPLARVSFAYDMKVLANASGGSGELPGYSFFYSLTGGTAASEWIAVPSLGATTATLGSVTSVSSTLSFATPLAAGATIYFRWADDNSDGTSPDQNFAIDNVSVQRVNSAPTLAGIEGGSLPYAENATATPVTASLTVADIDDVNMAGATVSISANFAVGQDVLGFANQNGISGAWNAASGVLTLSGASSVANYQAALRSVTYFNSSDDPSGLTRTVSFVVNDGALNSGAASRTITVTPVNDAPVITTSGGAMAYVENQAATAIDAGLTVADLDNVNLVGATVDISANFASGQDVLGFMTQNGISGAWNAASGVLTLSGSSSVANYQAALRSVTYFNSSDDPSGLPRTVSFVVNDGALNSAAANRSVTVTPVNDAPVVTTSGGAMAYTENQAATAVDAGLSVADLDNLNLVGATVSISANHAIGQDVLGFINQNGISGVWNGGTGVLTLSGTSSVANYQAALRSITYFNGSDDPSGLMRAVSFVVDDGASNSAAATRNITVTPVNDAPVVTTTGGALAYTENQAATTIDAGLTVADLDNMNLVGATISISANHASGEDVLGFADQNGITGAWNATTGVLTLTGTTTVANYQTALRSVTYFNSSDDPGTLARTVSFVVNDGALNSAAANRSVTVLAVNDAPLLSGSNNLGAINRNPVSNPGTLVADLIAGHASDADSPSLGIAVTGVVNANGSWEYSTNGGSSWTAFGTPGDGNARLLGANTSTFVRFVPNANWSGTVSGGLSFRAWEHSAALAGTTADTTANGNATAYSAATASASITVSAANAAPTLSGANNLGTINEDAFSNAGTLVSALIAGRVGDTDPAAVSGIAVTAVDNSNGSWQYTVNGGALWSNFVAPSSSAARLLAADPDTYVRFVPNPDWVGTVGSGLSFRAWDQTSGVAGSTANVAVNQTVLDRFNTVAYNNNDGSMAWSSDWIDVDANAVGGSYRIFSGQLQIKTTNNTDSIHRGVNLAGAGTATLSFSYTSDLNLGSGGQVNLRVSNNGGSSYTTIATFTSSLRTGSGFFSADISAYASAGTRVRFETVGISAGETLLVDNLQIAFGSSGGSGSAFSAASASSSITVQAVNDAPVRTAGNPPPVNVDEDSANVAAVTVGLASLAYGPGGGSDESGQTLSYRISTIPTFVTLWQADGSTPVLAGASLSLAQLRGLGYKTVADANGSGNLSWTVQDNGGIGNGGTDSLVESLAMTVVPVNDAPLVTSSGGGLAYLENQTATAIDPGLAVADIDNADLVGATVRISTNYAAGQDVLGFTNQNGISGAWDAATGVLTLSGTSSLTNYQAALRSVSYFNSSDDPSTLVRTVSFVVNDGALDSSAATRSITVTAVNDAPVVTTSAGVLAYTENQAPTAIDAGLTVVDVDNLNLVAATVSISANYAAGQDVLGFTNQNGIAGIWNAATGVLSLSGSSSVANYQAALRSVSYFNSSDDPGTLARTVSFVVNDGALNSAVASKTVTVLAVNDAPVVTTSAGVLAYTENQAAAAIDGGLTVADLDSVNLAGASVRISANYAAGQDVLGFTNQNGISGAWNAATGVLTLSGTSSLTNYQAALRSVSYFNSSDDPSTLVRTVSFVANDGALDSSAATRSITVTAVNDAPVVTTSAGVLAYTENQAPTAIDAGLTVVDVDNLNLVAATVSISANYAAGQDVLGFTNQNGISGVWNAATGVLSLSGSSSVANYQAALRSVSYFNSSDDPGTLARTVSFVVNDAALNSAVASKTVTVLAVNDAPVVTTSAGVLAYTENQAAAAIDGGLTVADLDSVNLAGASVRISANYAAGQDVLGFTNQNGISGAWNAATGVLTLSGTSSLTNYQAALRSVSYFNSSDDPSTLVRTVSFVVIDGALDSSAATRSITVTAVNDAPVVTTSAGVLAYTENQAPTAIDAGLTVVDVDNLNLVAATVSISANYAAGQDVLGFTNQNGIAGIWNAATGVLSLSGSSSVANYQAALRSVSYFNSSDDPGTLARTVSFVVNDAALNSAVASKTVTVLAVNDAPVVTTSGGALAYSEKQPATAIDIGLTVGDVDNLALTGATVSISANYANGEDVLGFTNQNGISGAWNAVTGVLTLSGTSSLTNYQAALRSVTYFNTSNDPGALARTVSITVNDGALASSIADKTVTVTPVNDAPVLVGSNDLAAINRNPGSNRGTLVLDLIAGHIRDADGSALRGIAVTAVDNSSGSWQFSTDGGSSWSTFGAPSTGAARLLAADLMTLVRFVPAVDYAGSLSGGLTYLAWDQTSGVAGNVADAGITGGSTAFSAASASASILVTSNNTAPVLSGANDLAAIDEDPVGDHGTLVSVLIAGKVTDSDPGAAAGIAVTAVDNSNGRWQFSLNDGSSWADFGSPAITSARLLAADAITRVRFVPDPDWNGSVASGLSFRAWDRSSGVAGSTADTGGTGGSFVDTFSAASYANNDGSLSWTSGWIENDAAGGGAVGGHIRIMTPVLHVAVAQPGDWIARQADLTGATSARLSGVLDNRIEGNGRVDVQLSSDGGASFTTLYSIDRFTFSGSYSLDITPFISSTTQVRLLVAAAGGQHIRIDDIRIESTTKNGGSTAFSSAIASAGIVVNPVNDAPVVTTSGGALAYIENQAASVIDGALTILDVDSATLASASVRITGNHVASEDVLLFVDQNGITGNWNASTGVLSLSGSSSLADYQTALRSVAYLNSSENPSALPRDITFVVNDGGADSSAASRAITVSPVNDAPLLETSTGSLAYLENQPAVFIDPALNVGDADNLNLVGARVSISANYAIGQDTLGFVDQNGIGGSWNSATGVLTLSGTASVADYQTALRSVSYFNSSDDPSALQRTVSFTVNDGALDSNVASRNVTVTPVNDAAVVASTGGALAYTENQTATAVDNGLLVGDVDNSNLVGATIAISSNYAHGEDHLGFTNQNGISGVWDLATGVLTLSGTSSVANYQAALRSVTYSNSSDDPGALARTVSFTVSDGALESLVASGTVAVAPVNDAPVVTASGGALAYTENQAAMVIDSGLTVADVDNLNLASAIVAISANYAHGEDFLGFSDQNGISGGWDKATGVLTLSGTSSVANYQAALRSVTYVNRSDDPSALPRTVSFVVNDGGLDSSIADRTVTVAPVNDAPVITTSAGALAYTENQLPTAVDDGLVVADIDNVDLAGATVSISSNFATGEDVLGFADQNGIGGSWNATTGVLTLSGTSSVANYQAALRSVSYVNGSDDPSTLARTISFTVSDGALTGVVASRIITVQAVNDAPAVTTTGGALVYTENQIATAIDSGLTVGDLDNVDLAGATITITSNFAAGEDVLGFTNQSGITGHWNGAAGVLTLSGTSSVANYQAALRSVTYFNNSDDPSTLERSISYVVDDGASTSAVSSKTVTVLAVNDAPLATNLEAAEAYTEDTPLKLAGIVISDVDNTTASATLSLSNSAAGSLNSATAGSVRSSYDATTGIWTASGQIADVNALLAGLIFTPAVDFNADFSITTSISDGLAAPIQGIKLLTGTPVNDAPTSSPVTLAPIAEDSGPRLITQAELLSNASDVDGPNLAAVNLAISSGGGSLIDNGDGSWTFLPALNDDSGVVFSYAVTDGSLSVAGSATLAITPVNDAPTTSPVTLSPIAEDSGPRLITQAELLANAADVDGPRLAAIRLAISNGLGSLVDNNDGSWTYTPHLDDDSAVEFSYLITDGKLSVAGLATLDITPVDDAPVGRLSPAIVQGGGTLRVDNRLLQVNDVDNAVESLAFNVIDVQHGRFESVGAPGVAILQFSQADVAAGRIVFVSTSAAEAPSFTIAPFDGNAYGDPIVASIDFRRSVLSTTSTADEGGVDQPTTALLEQIGSPDSRVRTHTGIDREASPVSLAEEPAMSAGRDLGTLPPPRSSLIAEAVQPDNPTLPAGASTSGEAASRPRRTSNFDNPDFYTRVSADDYVARLEDFQMIDLMMLVHSDSRGSAETFQPGPQAAEDQAGNGLTLNGAARASAVALTAGTVWWALRAGSLLTGLLVSLPTWRHADLLAVLPDEEDEDSWDLAEDKEAARDEQAVDLMFETTEDRGPR